MIEITIYRTEGVPTVELAGRIDGLSTAELDNQFETLTSAGERVLFVDLSKITYISSAGIRTFLVSQKTLKAIGGELILFGLSPAIYQTFKVSGLHSIFKILKDKEELQQKASQVSAPPKAISLEINGIKIEQLKFNTTPGKFFVIGDQSKMNKSEYSEKEVIAVKHSDIAFGTGLAALGDDFSEYKNLFGESMAIESNFFSYPAIKQPVVDFMLNSLIVGDLSYKFLHGFGFRGNYSSIIRFDELNEFITLSELLKLGESLSSSNLFGIVLLAESGGVYGMHLKKIPIIENKPTNGDIFDQRNFADWFDFPLEPANMNRVIAAVGVAVKDKSSISKANQAAFSSEANFHIHTGIFEKALLSKNIIEFEKELKRVISEMECSKVQHLLGKSKFKSGMFGIIELEAV